MSIEIWHFFRFFTFSLFNQLYQLHFKACKNQPHCHLAKTGLFVSDYRCPAPLAPREPSLKCGTGRTVPKVLREPSPMLPRELNCSLWCVKKSAEKRLLAHLCKTRTIQRQIAQLKQNKLYCKRQPAYITGCLLLLLLLHYIHKLMVISFHPRTLLLLERLYTYFFASSRVSLNE